MATGKVEMELIDYDQMKDTLNMYQEIINALTHPHIGSYALDWYNNHDRASIVISTENIMDNISLKSRVFLEYLIKSHVNDYLISSGIGGKFELDIGITVGLLRKGEDSKEGDTEE